MLIRDSWPALIPASFLSFHEKLASPEILVGVIVLVMQGAYILVKIRGELIRQHREKRNHESSE